MGMGLAAQGRRLHRASVRGRKGVALIMVLGVMSLLLILVMSYVYDASDTSSVAVNRVNETKSRLFSRSGVERAISFIAFELGDRKHDNVLINPASSFYESSHAEWAMRAYLPTVAPDFDTDISAQMTVRFGDYTFVPATAADALPGIGWSAIVGGHDGSVDGSATMTDEYLGRVAYLIIDETGKIDPSFVVTQDSDETAATTRTGESASEIQLIHVLGDNAMARAFHPVGSTTGYPGQMPDVSKWMSYTHIYNSVPQSQTEADSIAAFLVPMSVADAEEFWIDVNSDSVATANELVPRLDLSRVGVDITAPMIYDHLLGVAAGNTTRDDTSCYSPWLVAQSPTDTAHARRLAAQIAVNMLDWVDDGSSVTHGYIDSGANHALTVQTDGGYTRPAGTEAVVHGVEDYLSISKLAIRSNYLFPLATMLNMQPALFVQMSSPTGTGVPADGFEVSVSVTFVLANALGGTYSVTRTLSLDDTDFNAQATNGDAIYYNMSGWKNFPSIGMGNVTLAGLTTFMVQSVRINSIEVTHKAGPGDDRPMPVVRSHAGGSDTDFVCEWRETGLPLHALGSLFTHYVMIEAKDPLMNVRSELDGDFTDYWVKTPSNSPSILDIVSTVLTAIGLGREDDPAVSSDGYDTHHDYCDVTIGDGSFTRLGQLGRVHDAAPNRSLRFWSKPGESGGHDTHLLDMFTIGSQVQVDGRINPNSRHSQVIRALAGNTGLDLDAVATGMLAANGTTGGTPFAYRGDMVGLFEEPTTTTLLNRYDDETAEDAMAAMAGLSSTRHNYFTVVSVGEAAIDLGHVPLQPTGTYHWRRTVDDQYARTLARCKVMAFVYRDAYTNKMKVMRYEQVFD